MPVRIVAFEHGHVPAAARLLAGRHGEHRLHEALLASPADFVPLVEQELGSGSGLVALRGNEVVGYLIGETTDDDLGRPIRIGPAGWGAVEPGLLGDLYAEAAEGWVAAGLRRHFVFVPNMPAYIEAWFRLSFGGSAALGIRGLDDETGLTCPESAVTVRRSTPADLEAIVDLSISFDRDLNTSPSFASLQVTASEQHEREWAGVWTDDRMELFVAELDGEVVGEILLYRRPQDLRVPPSSIDLGNAVVKKEHRGKGVGLIMTRHVVEWARREGYKVMTTDWRWTNLPAARFWPKRGFREVYTRLYRSIP